MADNDLDIPHILDTRPQKVVHDGVAIHIDWSREYEYPSAYDANAWNRERGICATVVGVRGAREPFAEATYADYIRYAWRGMPTQVVGIHDVGAALTALIDTGRAHRAYAEAARDRAAITRQRLAEAAQGCAAALAIEPGAERWMAMQRANLTREEMVLRAMADGLLDAEEIGRLADMRDEDIERLARYADPEPPAFYLSAEEVARRLGIAPRSVSAYVSRGDLPAPDHGDRWSLSLIEEWQRTRAGRGRRTDLRP